MLNWDDMRVFIAVAQCGSFSAAARRIGLDPTTVARRIERLEASLKSTLVARRPNGLELTAAGVALAEAGAHVEAAVEHAQGNDQQTAITGTVRISVAEGFCSALLAPALPEFLDRHPGLRIEIDASPGYLSPTTRKVDLAITSSPPTGTRLVVERLADYELGLYASSDYLAKYGVPQSREELACQHFVGWVDDLIYSDQLRFLDSFNTNLPRRIKCSSMKVQINLAEAGAGIGAFPHFLVKALPQMTRILPDLVAVRTYWMASHAELHDLARLRLLRRWIEALVRSKADIMMPS